MAANQGTAPAGVNVNESRSPALQQALSSGSASISTPSGGSYSSPANSGASGTNAPSAQPDGQLKLGSNGQPIQYPQAPQGASDSKSALSIAQASGTPPPQDSASASAAVQDFYEANAGTPTFYKPTTPVQGFDPQTIFDSKGNALSHDQYLAAGGKDDFSNVQDGSPPSKTSPDNTTPNVDNFFNSNENVAQQASDIQEYLSPKATQDQLTQELAQINTDQATLSGLNTQFMNIENVMKGTEGDIRSEIQAAGGFGTNSQVMALTTARNKVLLQQATTIQQSIANEKAIVANDTKLYADEKTFAQQQYTQRSNSLKLAEANQKQIDTAVKGSYNAVVKTMGYSGLYASLQGDPQAVSNAESALGLQSGELEKLATGSTGTISTYQTTPQGTFKVTTKNGQVVSTTQQKPTKASANSSSNLTGAVNKVDGYFTNNAGQDGYVSPQTYKSAKQAWIQDGHPATTFDSKFNKYANPADVQDYRGGNVSMDNGINLASANLIPPGKEYSSDQQAIKAGVAPINQRIKGQQRIDPSGMVQKKVNPFSPRINTI